MGGFLGSYLYQVDEKGRVTLPAAFRKGRDEFAPFVLIHVHEDALTLYPEENWLEVEVRLREHARRTPRARHFALGLTANATVLTPDRQGTDPDSRAPSTAGGDCRRGEARRSV